MLESLRNFLRCRDLSKHSSKTPTGIVPLGKVRSAVVFIPAGEALPETVSLIRRSLEGKQLTIFSLTPDKKAPVPEGTILLSPRDLTWTGRVRRSKRVPQPSRGEDLFISLFGEDPFAVSYAASCSTASFKVGRSQDEGELYDFVMATPDGETSSCAEAFREMMRVMDKIK